jgi:hypothetical protein
LILAKMLHPRKKALATESTETTEFCKNFGIFQHSL